MPQRSRLDHVCIQRIFSELSESGHCAHDTRFSWSHARGRRARQVSLANTNIRDWPPLPAMPAGTGQLKRGSNQAVEDPWPGLESLARTGYLPQADTWPMPAVTDANPDLHCPPRTCAALRYKSRSSVGFAAAFIACHPGFGACAFFGPRQPRIHAVGSSGRDSLAALSER